MSRDDVLVAALPLLETHGVDGLTLKAVADALNVSAPAVYHYFDGREDLLDRLCERVAADVDPGVADGLPWDEAIIALVVEMDATFGRYPGVAPRVLPVRRPSPAAGRMSRRVHELICGAGFSDHDADELLATLHFLVGGWLLGQRPMLADHTSDRTLLARSARWILDGFCADRPRAPRDC